MGVSRKQRRIANVIWTRSCLGGVCPMRQMCSKNFETSPIGIRKLPDRNCLAGVPPFDTGSTRLLASCLSITRTAEAENPGRFILSALSALDTIVDEGGYDAPSAPTYTMRITELS